MQHDVKVPMILRFAEIEGEALGLVGGKGYNLGRLVRHNFPIPPGFCVTTEAYRQWLEGDEVFASLLAELETLAEDDLRGVQKLGESIRSTLHERAIPEVIEQEVLSAWKEAGEERAFAVRSSATAEDLPDASFAGQQDTYLNVMGQEALLDSVRRCWASLYTDRAIVYRMQNQIPHREVALSVVVQRMVQPETSGILFTADPLTGHRGVATIDAGFGLGEALVSGLISADLYKVHRKEKRILEKVVGDKTMEIISLPGGGTEHRPLSPERRKAQVLTETQILALAELGGRVEAMQGSPQDIEWCFEKGELYLVQSRPITSLYPIPQPAPCDGYDHYYFCFNHFQVMLDPMPALAREIWARIFPVGKKDLHDPNPSPLMLSAGNRLYVDFAPFLRRAPVRKALVAFIGRVDALAQKALVQLIERPTFSKGPKLAKSAVLKFALTMMGAIQKNLWFKKPEGQTEFLTDFCDETVEKYRKQWAKQTSLPDFFAQARKDLAFLLPELFFKLPPRIVAGVIALVILRKLLPAQEELLSALGRGLKGNATTEMDLEVGDLADIARRSPVVVEMLKRPETSWEDLKQEPQAAEFNAALDDFLAKYGARGPSEIDVSRERWEQNPESLLRTLSGNLSTSKSGTHRQHHEALGEKADKAAEELLKLAGKGFWGWLRRPLVHRMIRVHRNLFGLREHPKFVLVRIFNLFRKRAIEAGQALVAQGSLAKAEDVFFLETAEIEEALRKPGEKWLQQAEERKEEHKRFQEMFPPRVMTQDGEIPVVRHSLEDVPEGALVGSPASAGVIEGVARVILDPTREVLQKGEILVAPFTDPGWTPLFINASGLVMEVGGQLTHGSVVAREYGIPAVVAVPDCTRLLKTGQILRVDGDRGVIEILAEPGEEVS
jgi:pyruvate,water dikinase